MNETSDKKIEFKIFGLSIEYLSISYGLFLILWGVIISLLSGSNSFTSYIPSIIGLPILIFSFLAIKVENKKKLFMHLVVFFGIIALLGGLDFFRSLLSEKFFQNYWADMSKFVMLVSGIFFVYQCVRSFIHTRENKD
tara:strand:+ start:458 stop:871 length:414 start_codon:yes stop_codon:yes gene_type:complete